MTWRVHSDRVFAIGGVRALILQALHPLTMAAVAQQRGFEEDFWGRLDRTGRYVSTLTYAPASQAQRLAAQVRGIHRKLRGTDPDTGDTFRLDRPDLLLWVHCCEVESFLTTARRAGAPISDADADEYLREQLLTARMIGIPEAMVPTSVREMTQYFADVRPELRLTDAAQKGVRVLAVPPMPKRVRLLTPARPAWASLAGIAFALLPKWARRIVPVARSADHRPGGDRRDPRVARRPGGVARQLDRAARGAGGPCPGRAVHAAGGMTDFQPAQGEGRQGGEASRPGDAVDQSVDQPVDPAERVRRIAIAMAALSQSGLIYAVNEYDPDRYTKLGALAADLLAVVTDVRRSAGGWSWAARVVTRHRRLTSAAPWSTTTSGCC